MDQLVAILVAYKYLVIFPVAVVEGPIITIICGFLSSLGILNFFLAYIILVIADLVGDTLFYILGRFGRIKFIDRWGHYIGINKERVIKIEKHFDGHTGKTIIIGKFSNFGAAFVLVAAGVAKTPYLKFLLFNIIATVPKSLILITFGFFFGHAYNLINRYIDSFSIIASGLVIIAILLYILLKKIKSKKL